jgi:hypothetical protein
MPFRTPRWAQHPPPPSHDKGGQYWGGVTPSSLALRVPRRGSGAAVSCPPHSRLAAAACQADSVFFSLPPMPCRPLLDRTRNLAPTRAAWAGHSARVSSAAVRRLSGSGTHLLW